MQRMQSAQRRADSFLDQAYLEALSSDAASLQSPFAQLYNEYHRRWKYAPVARVAYLIVLLGLTEGLHTAPAAAFVMAAGLLGVRALVGYAGSGGVRIDLLQCWCTGCERRCGDGCAGACCPQTMPRCCYCSCCTTHCGVRPGSEYDMRVPKCRRQPVVGLVEGAGAATLAIVALLLATVVPYQRSSLPLAYEVSTPGAVLIGLIVSVVLLLLLVVQGLAAAAMVTPREWARLEHATGLSRLRFSLFGTGIDQLVSGDVLVAVSASRHSGAANDPLKAP